jgi:hypothetical protein
MVSLLDTRNSASTLEPAGHNLTEAAIDEKVRQRELVYVLIVFIKISTPPRTPRHHS